MALAVIGARPFDKDANGDLISRIATIFPNANTIVTLPGMHATQRFAFTDGLSQKRVENGQPALTEAELAEAWRNSVDLIIEEGLILIRPDPGHMEIAFRADELLQEFVSKRQIQFLNASNENVRRAIKRRGEYWRINPLPSSPDEMKQMILSSRIGIGGKEMYYYNKTTGTRFLTCQEFARLAAMDEADLRRHLLEIQAFSARENRFLNPEVAFFMAERSFSSNEFAAHDFSSMGAEAVRPVYEALARKFREATPQQFRRDDLNDLEWRNRMFTALAMTLGETPDEEMMLGLSPEFFMQIEWLAGGRIDGGELIFDPIFDERARGSHDETLTRVCDQKVRGFIFNFIREHGGLEYVNVGRVVGTLSARPAFRGRRGVYIAELRPRGTAKEIVKIIRLQKWGVHEHLDAGESLLDAMIQSEEYTEYILDRRLGCNQLGMNLPLRIGARKISERYFGKRAEYEGTTIWTPYFDRDYIDGIATDKVPKCRLENETFALLFARLLGRAAAPNLIVGRLDAKGNVLFDDGDEVLVSDAAGMPTDIVVADPTGSFADYRTDLDKFAVAYAGPVARRTLHVANTEQFLSAYIEGLTERFIEIQREYRKRRRGFDTLFKHARWDEAGSFAYRWEQVLARLDRTNPAELAELIRKNVSAG